MLKKDRSLRVVNFNENRNKREQPTEAHKNRCAKHNIEGALCKTECDAILYAHNGLASDFFFQAFNSLFALALELVQVEIINRVVPHGLIGDSVGISLRRQIRSIGCAHVAKTCLGRFVMGGNLGFRYMNAGFAASHTFFQTNAAICNFYCLHSQMNLS